MPSDLVFVAATAAPDAGDDVAAQTALTLARLDEKLRSRQSSLESAASITIYLRHARDFAALNDEYRQAFSTAPPARTTVVADLLTRGALVEMSAVGLRAGDGRDVVHPPGWLLSPNPYSYAVRSDPFVLLSGLLSRNVRDNTAVGGDVATQTRTVLENAREVLEAAGLSFDHVVSARVYLTDLGDFAEMNRVYGGCFGERPPARATVGAALTAPGYNVEITFVASAAPRRVVDADVPRYPNVSPAVVSGSALFAAGMLADEPLRGQPAAEARDILQQLDRVLSAAGFHRRDIRELVVYVTNDRAAEDALAMCRDVLGGAPAITIVKAALAVPAATIELTATGIR